MCSMAVSTYINVHSKLNHTCVKQLHVQMSIGIDFPIWYRWLHYWLDNYLWKPIIKNHSKRQKVPTFRVIQVFVQIYYINEIYWFVTTNYVYFLSLESLGWNKYFVLSYSTEIVSIFCNEKALKHYTLKQAATSPKGPFTKMEQL